MCDNTLDFPIKKKLRRGALRKTKVVGTSTADFEDFDFKKKQLGSCHKTTKYMETF